MTIRTICDIVDTLKDHFLANSTKMPWGDDFVCSGLGSQKCLGAHYEGLLLILLANHVIKALGAA